MMRRFAVPVLAIALVVLALSGLTQAQESAPPADGTPVDLLCATPVSDTSNQPDVIVTAPETDATPEGVVDPGTRVGLYPCGTPDANSTPIAEAVGTAETGIVVAIDMIDIAYTQPELTIPADTDVTLRVSNKGLAVHNVMIDNPKIFSGQLYGGDTVDIVVNLPAGVYTFYCTVPGHRAAGMIGTLTAE